MTSTHYFGDNAVTLTITFVACGQTVTTILWVVEFTLNFNRSGFPCNHALSLIHINMRCAVVLAYKGHCDVKKVLCVGWSTCRVKSQGERLYRGFHYQRCQNHYAMVIALFSWLWCNHFTWACACDISCIGGVSWLYNFYLFGFWRRWLLRRMEGWGWKWDPIDSGVELIAFFEENLEGFQCT